VFAKKAQHLTQYVDERPLASDEDGTCVFADHHWGTANTPYHTVQRNILITLI